MRVADDEIRSGGDGESGEDAIHHGTDEIRCAERSRRDLRGRAGCPILHDGECFGNCLDNARVDVFRHACDDATEGFRVAEMRDGSFTWQSENLPEGHRAADREIDDTAIEADIERGDTRLLLKFTFVVERGDSREREEIHRVEDEIGTRNDTWKIFHGEILGNFFDIRFRIDGAYMPCEGGSFVDTDVVFVVELAIEIVDIDGVAVGEDEFGESHARGADRERTPHATTGNEEAGIFYFLLYLRCDVFDIAQGEEVIVRWLSVFHSRIIFIGYHPSIVPFLVCVV